MRILFLRSNPVDPDSRVEKEVNSLLKRGDSVDIFAWDRSQTYAPRVSTLHLSAGDCKIVRVGIRSRFGGGMKKNLLPLLRFQCRIVQYLCRHKQAYDGIHACDFDTAFFARLASGRGRRFVYDIFDYYVDSFSVPGILRRPIERMDRWVISHADATILCTEERRSQIAGSVPKKIVVIHNTPAEVAENFAFPLQGTLGRIRIVYVGILSENRKIIELCEWVAQRADFELHIGGFGAAEKRVAEIAKRVNNVFFYGKLPYADTLALEKNCDIISALYDPRIRNHQLAAPNKFYEALYLGKPLVMAEGTGMSPVIRAADIGAVVPFDHFEEGFLALAAREREWPQMARQARKVYQEQYSWQEMEKRLFALYDDLQAAEDKKREQRRVPESAGKEPLARG